MDTEKYLELKSKYVDFPDNDLLKIVTTSRNEYEEYAIKAAESELLKRGINFNTDENSEDSVVSDIVHTEEMPKDYDNSKEFNLEETKQNNIRLKDIINFCDIEGIKDYISHRFPSFVQYTEKYLNVLNTLKSLKPIDSDICLSLEFNEYTRNENYYFQIVAIDINNKEIIDAAFCEWAEWLGYLIFEPQVKSFGYNGFVAQCIFSMTTHGFTEDEITQSFNKMMETANGFDDGAIV